MGKDKGKYTGWSYRGRPFSEAQYRNSYLKKTKGLLINNI